MDWEIIITKSTISSCPIITPIEEPRNLHNLELQHTHKRTGPPLPLTMPKWRSKGKREPGWNSCLSCGLGRPEFELGSHRSFPIIDKVYHFES
jgi:hypothetical protein